MLRILCLLAILTLISCEFNPSEIQITDVEKPVDISPVIDLNINDTVVYIFGNSASMHYKVDIHKSWIDQINFYLDSVLLDFSPYKDNEDYFIITKPQTGVDHYLSMEMQIYSGNNSLAGMMGKEYIIKKYKWRIIFLDKLPPVKLLKVEPYNGQLKITWEKTKVSNFYKYVINRKIRIGDQTLSHSVFEIKDFNQNEFIDSSFIGGENAEFYIDLYSSNNSSAKSNTITFNDPIKLYMEWDDEFSKYTVRWTKCKYPGNFKGYHLKAQIGYNDYGVIYSSNNLNDTVFVTNLKGVLDGLQYFSVLYQSKATSILSIDLDWTYDVSAFLGPPSTNIFLDVFTKTMFPPYYIYNDGYYSVNRYNPIDGSLQTFPANNQHAKIMAVAPDNSFLMVDSFLYSNNNLNSYQKSIFDAEYTYLPRKMNIAINGVRAISTYYNNKQSLYNFNTKQQTLLYNSSYDDELTISPNGKYLVVSNNASSTVKIYSINNMALMNEATISAKINGLFFTADTVKSEFIYYSQGKIVKWSCDESTIIKSVTCDSEVSKLIDLDPISNKLLAYNYRYLTFYDVKDLSLVKRINHSVQFPYLLVLYNSTIYYRGFQYKFKL